jgi:DNA repair ATPase RecN
MNLFQALKQKSALINEIKKIKERIKQHNEVIQGNPRPYDTEALAAELEKRIQALVQLKTQINQANQPIQDKIYRLSELKALADFYKYVPTQDGRAVRGYNEEAQVYESQIKALARDQKIDAIELEIQDIQNEIDAYNATATLA